MIELLFVVTTCMYFICGKYNKVPMYVLNKTFLLIARITKMGYFSPGYMNIFHQINQVCELSPEHRVVGFLLLTAIIQEINIYQRSLKISLLHHSKVSSNFRDNVLLEIVKNGVSAVHDCLSGTVPVRGLRIAALKMLHAAFTFNFVSSFTDESSDDVGATQIPRSWREVVGADGFVKCFVDTYLATRPPESTAALECMGAIASFRRTIFLANSERTKFLTSLLESVVRILDAGSAGLANSDDDLSMFWRMLTALKTNYVFKAVLESPMYEAWITRVFSFSLQTLAARPPASSAVHYLMMFWSKMVYSANYTWNYCSGPSTTLYQKSGSMSDGACGSEKESPETYLELCTPKITEAFVMSCINSVAQAIQSGDPEVNPLNSDGATHECLENVPTIARYEYAETGCFMVRAFDTLTAALCSRPLTPGTPESDLALGQCAWLVYLVGAFIKEKAYRNEDDRLATDRELVSRVVSLMEFTDKCTPAIPREIRASEDSAESVLEKAYVYFWQEFCKAYTSLATSFGKLGDSMDTADGATAESGSSVAVNLSVDEKTVGAILEKVVRNIELYRGNDAVIGKSIKLFSDLVSGHTTGPLVLNLNITARIIEGHAAAALSFAETKAGEKHCHLFYSALGKIMATERYCDRFDAFMEPIGAAVRSSLAPIPAPPTVTPQQAQAQQRQQQQQAVHVVSVLRGLFSAAASDVTYGQLFDWLSTNYIPALALFADRYGACNNDGGAFFTVLMKLVAEIANNKSHRISFGQFSPNGYALFSQVVRPTLLKYVSYTANIRPLKDPYREKYRNIAICARALTNALTGGYMNLAAFALYNDPTLRECATAVLALALSVPAQDLFSYEQQLAAPIFSCLEALSAMSAQALLTLPAQLLDTLFADVLLAMKSSNTDLVTCACTFVDNLLSVCITKKDAPLYAESVKAFEAAVSAAPATSSLGSFVPAAMAHLLATITLTDTQLAFTMSKALYPLVLVFPQAFQEIKVSLVQSQPQVHHQKMMETFATLEAAIAPKLTDVSREKFSQAVSIFTRDVKLFIGSNPN